MEHVRAVSEAEASHVVAARAENWRTRRELNELDMRCERAEILARWKHPVALAVPEDLCDWEEATPRIRGLAVRIGQVKSQEAAVQQIAPETTKGTTHSDQ